MNGRTVWHMHNTHCIGRRTRVGLLDMNNTTWRHRHTILKIQQMKNTTSHAPPTQTNCAGVRKVKCICHVRQLKQGIDYSKRHS